MDTAIAVATTEDKLSALADLLERQGSCDAKTLDRARRVAVESGQRLDLVLIQLGLVTERGLADAYAALLGTRIAGPDRYPADERLLADRLTTRFLRGARAMPVALEHGLLVVAAADPLDPFTPAAIAAATGLAVLLEVAVPIEIEAAFDRLYRDDDADPAAAGGHEGDQPLEEDAERLKDLASEAPVIRLVNQIIARAVETQASDIHIEPFEDRLRVRYRYDGVLQEAESPAARLTPAITSRIKIMARLDIAERRLPQDGRIKLAVRGQEVDFRVSTIPSLWGETVVMRVLDRTAVAFDYARLGLPPEVIGQFSRRAGPAQWHRAGHRADRQRQDHHPVQRPAVAQFGQPQGGHGRGPDRVPVARHQPDPGQAADRPQLRDLAALDPAPGSGRHHGRRDPRPGDRADRRAGGADRASGVEHAAYQLGGRDHHPAARHGPGGLPSDRRAARRAGAAAGAQAVRRLPARGRRAAGDGAAVRTGPAHRGRGRSGCGIRSAARRAAIPAIAAVWPSPSSCTRRPRSSG